MRILKLKTLEADKRILRELEKRRLIRTLKPTAKVIRKNSACGGIDTIYSSSPEFGTHKLICVGLGNGSQKIRLNSHPDNEEFIIISERPERFKPLYIIIGLHKHKVIADKIRRGRLSEKDFVALRLKYNEARMSVFTMLKDTPHYEFCLPAAGMPPIFFVVEPSRLKMRYLSMGEYSIKLERKA